MDNDEIVARTEQCPVVFTFSDGRTYVAESPRHVIVGGGMTSIMFSMDGIKRHTVVSNDRIASIEPYIEPESPLPQ